MQWNKTDLADDTSRKAIETMRREGRQPVFEAIAVQGIGVVETFLELVDLTFARIDRVYHLSEKLSLTRQEFIEEVRRCLIDPPELEHAGSGPGT